MSKVTLFIIIGAIIMLTLATIAVIHDQKGQTSITGGQAVLIHGSCAIINWDADEETWEAAHSKWQELKGNK